MADLSVAVTNVAKRRPAGSKVLSHDEPLEFLIGRAKKHLTLTTGITSAVVQDAGADWVAGEEGVIRMVSAGGACWVKVGAAPVAAAGDGWRMEAGSELKLAVVPGDKIAAING